MTDYTMTFNLSALQEDAKRRTIARGYEPRMLQLKWRNDPPPYPDENNTKAVQEWWSECMDAIIEALVFEGVPAWPGDATGCVQQIVAAVARQKK